MSAHAPPSSPKRPCRHVGRQRAAPPRLRAGSAPVRVLPLATAAAMIGLVQPAARAERLDNEVAVFSALDKVTARISKFEVPLNQTTKFGALKITPRVCYSRPATEQPKTTSFVEVEETLLDGSEKRIFSGWMFAESPGLNAVEHPVFDVWLTGCQQPVKTATSPQPADQKGAGQAASGTPAANEQAEPRRRVRR